MRVPSVSLEGTHVHFGPVTHPDAAVFAAFKAQEAANRDFWKVFLWYLRNAGLVTPQEWTSIKMSACQRHAVSYNVRLNDHREAVEQVIKNMSQMTDAGIRLAASSLEGMEGRGFYYRSDPAVQRPLTYEQETAFYNRYAQSGESESEASASTSDLTQSQRVLSTHSSRFQSTSSGQAAGSLSEATDPQRMTPSPIATLQEQAGAGFSTPQGESPNLATLQAPSSRSQQRPPTFEIERVQRPCFRGGRGRGRSYF